MILKVGTEKKMKRREEKAADGAILSSIYHVVQSYKDLADG